MESTAKAAFYPEGVLMKRILAVTLLSTAAAMVAIPTQAATLFRSTLSGAQEVPPNASTATGTATLTLNDAQDRLEISVQLNGIDLDGNQTPDPGDDLTVAHIHRAPFGSNGPVVFGFVGPNSDVNGDLIIDPFAGTVTSAWDLNEGNGTTLAAELGNLFAGRLYFNFHTNEFPPGEIRGQIVPVPEPTILSSFAMLGLGLFLKKNRRTR